MSESLRDSAEGHFQNTLSLMQKGKPEEALKELEKTEEAALGMEAYDIFLYVQTLKGHLMQTLGAYEEALKIHVFSLKATEELLSKDPDNELYQSSLQMNLDEIFTLGNRFYNIGRFLQAKNCYEIHLLTFQKLLETDPENVAYQSDVAMTLNNLGTLLSEYGAHRRGERKIRKSPRNERKTP